MQKRIIMSIMVIAFTLTAVMSGYAESPKVYEQYQHEGVTYLNIENVPLNSPQVFYRQLLGTRRSELGGFSVAECYLLLAASMANNHTAAHGISRAKQFELAKGALLKKPDPLTSQWSNAADAWYPGGDGLYSQTTPLTWVTVGGRTYLQMNMRVLNYYDLVVIFTDPSLLALFPDADVKDNYVSTSSVTTENAEVDDTKSLWNRSSNTTTKNTTKWDETKSSSLTNTVEESKSGSSTFTYTEGIEVGAKFDVGVANVSTKVNFSASQAFSNAWSKTEAESKAQTDSKTTAVELTQDLPAWTAILLSKYDTTLVKTTKYYCPMGVRFFFTAFAQNADGSNQQGFAQFGKDALDAQQELYRRAYLDGVIDGIDRGGITWSTIKNDPTFAEILKYCATMRTVATQEATIEINRKTQTFQNEGMYPIRALKYVRIVGDTSKTMNIGDSESTLNISINGYNDMNTEYVAFNALAGHWIVTDANGKVLDTDKAPVKIITDSAGKNARYSAVRAGKCYLKYIIDEDTYGTAENNNYKTKNSDLTSTAMLAINVVSGTNLHYEIKGSYIGVNGNPAEAIYGTDKLSVVVTDETGLQINDTNYYWQARELKSAGISLTEDGMVSFTKPGRFNVRVVDRDNSNNFSDWKKISVENYGSDYNITPLSDEVVQSSEGAVLIISGKYTGGTENAPENIEGDSRLSVVAYDSTGKIINLAYTWESESTSGIDLDADGTVSFSQLGTYRVRVKNGETYSEWHSVTANEFAPARILNGGPSPSYNLYTGSDITLINGVRAENGTVVYALGTNAGTVPALEEFSDTLPTAKELGTYYVWYMAAGDEMHTNSEPECIVVKIVSTPEEFGVTFDIEGYFAADANPDVPVKIEGDNKLTVKAYSVFYGTEVEDAQYEWELAEDYDDAELTADGTITFHKVGTYNARVRYGDSVSDIVALHGVAYIPASVLSRPTANNSVYTGLPIELVSAGTAQNGTMKYALGTDETTEPLNDEYSEDIPTGTQIGTYNVWFKVFADTSEYINSEPEYVSVKIAATEEEVKRILNSSSGGCDSGFSLMSLGVLALIMRRKSK